MNKIQFFNTLEKSLRANMVSEKKITQILRDYEEYFIENSRMGKTDQEIIAKLGKPDEIALSYDNSNINVKEEMARVNQNIRVVTCKAGYYLTLFVMFVAVTIFMAIFLKSVWAWGSMLATSLGLLGFGICEIKKLKKYKAIKQELLDVEKEGI